LSLRLSIKRNREREREGERGRERGRETVFESDLKSARVLESSCPLVEGEPHLMKGFLKPCFIRGDEALGGEVGVAIAHRPARA